MPKHPENRGERNPLASRKLKKELMKNRFVPKKKSPKSAANEGITAPVPEKKNDASADSSAAL